MGQRLGRSAGSRGARFIEPLDDMRLQVIEARIRA
jgi:hypothetical protein